MPYPNFHAISVANTGATVTTTVSTSQNAALPNTSAGTRPRFVRFSSTGRCHVRLGMTGPVAVLTDTMVQPGDAIVLTVGSFTHWAVIDAGVSVTLNVTPMEDS